MSLDRLRYCAHVKRVVATDEFHAGVFTSGPCSGCEPIPAWMEGMVRADARLAIERAQRHLDLLDGNVQ